jgi:hypothetical protein
MCGCQLHRTGAYATPTIAGRSHATSCPWGREGESDVFCYECHEELLHNPVLLPEDISAFAQLARMRGLSESTKTDDRSKIAGRVLLLHEVIARGLKSLCEEAEIQPYGGDYPRRDSAQA